MNIIYINIIYVQCYYNTSTVHTAGVSHHYVSAMFCWRDPGSDESTHSDRFPSCSE